ncbi:MAG: lyase family protein [Pseudomonadota bacterium]
MESFREESDSLGTVTISDQCLYGSNTARALQNFPFNGVVLGQEQGFVTALAELKQGCLLANHELGLISDEVTEALLEACDEMIKGDLNQHLVVSILEGSGGTSTNMNINEVLANRALLALGYSPGRYDVIHPNDHVNCGQSTNDVIPSAMKLAIYRDSEQLAACLGALAVSLSSKGAEFADVYRLGRTCLQDGQPMTLGQAFEGYAAVIERAAHRLQHQGVNLLSIPLGGTAIGTGLGSAAGFRSCVFKHLKHITGLEIEPAANRFDGMQNLDEFQRLSSEIETATAAMGKIAKDLILLSSGPKGGLGEISLPAVQPGSSIMPGKVNPVIAMSVVQLSQLVHGNHACISMACQDGQLEINHYEPVVASRLLDSLHRSVETSEAFRSLCIEGIEADIEKCYENLYESYALATTMVPKLGYARVSQLVKDSLKQQKPFLQMAEDCELVDSKEIDELIRSTVLIK